MTYTENLNLSLPEASDPLDAAPLSANFTALDAAVAAMQTETAGCYSPTNKPYVVGTYTGDGADSQAITLGFKPSFLIISCALTTDSTANCFSTNTAIYAPGCFMGGLIVLSSSGFRVYSSFTLLSSTYSTPKLNVKDHVYAYIALR